MKLFKIQTENVNRSWIQETTSVYFEGFTIYETTGYWKSKAEKSLVIEVLTDEAWKIDNLAKAIKEHNSQESVLIETLTPNYVFV